MDFPIAEVSEHAAEEKAIRHGHPSTLHLWWARRPLASSRSVLMSLLLPDPVDPNCPVEFKRKTREVLKQQWLRGTGDSDGDLQRALVKFIGHFADWSNSSDSQYLEVARILIRAAHGIEPPLVVDPFAGGGSIPLEALRLECDVFASDLNPVACLILKTMLEDLPREGIGLIEKIQNLSSILRDSLEKELSEFYPTDRNGGRPIAYLWARTVQCESPNCGAEIPLMKSFWLCRKEERKTALRYRSNRHERRSPSIELEVFRPKNDEEVPEGTVSGARARCSACKSSLAPARVRAQLFAQHGGSEVRFDHSGRRIGGARLLAVATLRRGESGRNYRVPQDSDYYTVWRAQKHLANLAKDKIEGKLSVVPDEPIATPRGKPYGADKLYFNFLPIVMYGFQTWGDLFTSRQKVALIQLTKLIREIPEAPEGLALVVGKLADLSNAACPWEPVAECPRQVLNHGRIKPSWDFAEGVPISESSGSFAVCLENLLAGLKSILSIKKVGEVSLAPAQKSPLPDASVAVWFTDPPYYDAIPYADLSDFFFVWFKRAFPKHPILRDPFDPTNVLTPKLQEVIDNLELLRGIPKDQAEKEGIPVKDRLFFAREMTKVFTEGRRVLSPEGVGCVVFAHKTTEGWEALLTAIIASGLQITGSWPIATEMAHRLRARDSAALATSVHIVLRSRPENAPVGDWNHVLHELSSKVKTWMRRLAGGGIRGADLVFACIGPALSIFSRYARVELSDGTEVKLTEFLEKVWEVIGRTALGEILGSTDQGQLGGLEEDARLTALFLWTLQSTAPGSVPGGTTMEFNHDGDELENEDMRSRAGYKLPYDVVRRFSQPLGIRLDQWNGRIIEIKKGIVRLLTLAERSSSLFGKDDVDSIVRLARRRKPKGRQMSLFPDPSGPRVQVADADSRVRTVESAVDRATTTTLDRVHSAMLLQKAGQTAELRELLAHESGRGSDFSRLSNALSALYPLRSEDRRLVEAVTLAIRRWT